MATARKTAHPPDTTERLGGLIRQMMDVVVQRSAGEMLCVMAESGLSMPQIVTLVMLKRHGPHSISGIAQSLSLSLAATSHLVDRMVKQNFVVRTEDDIDRRAKRVTLTAAGIAVLDRIAMARSREVAQTLSSLPTELREQFEHLLTKIVEQLKEQK